MEFEEFVELRAVELLRFAHILTGDPARAAELVTETVAAARPHWSAVEAVGRPFGVLRVGVSRAYLSDDRSVGTGEPAAEFAALSPHQRAVLVLGDFAGQTDEEIAAAVQTAREQVAAERADGLAVLGFEVDDESRRMLRELLDDFADSLQPDAAALRSALAAPAEGEWDDSPGTLAALFGVSETTTGRAPDAPYTPAQPEPAQGSAAEPAQPSAAEPAQASAAEPVRPSARDESSVEHDDAALVTVSPSIPATAPASASVAAAGGPPGGASSSTEHLRPGSRIGRVLLLVAIVVVATALAVLVTKRTNDPSAAAPRSVGPTPSASSTPVTLAGGSLYSSLDRTLPGGRVLREFLHSGPRTVTGAVYAVATDRQLVINAVCSGTGGATIGPVTISRCDGSPVAAAVPTRSITSVSVRAATSTTWRFVVVDSPPIATNAALTYPASSVTDGSSATTRAARTSGTGSASVALVSGTTQPRATTLRILLTCSGGGIGLATSDGALTGGVITTCYRGWAYEFDVARAQVPGTLRITAPSSTSWSLLVARA